jgi:hypothetical protein
VVSGDLARILSGHAVRSDYGDPPSAFVLEQQGTFCLWVSYALSKGVHGRPDGTAFEIRAYQAVDHQLKLLAATGDNMDGTFTFIRDLNSPLPNEKWLLAWGKVTGSNGFGVSAVRVYAFDGRRFRTVWSPSEFEGATAEVTQTGFTLRHCR